MGNLRMCGCEWLDGGKTFRECADHAELRQRVEQAERERDEWKKKFEDGKQATWLVATYERDEARAKVERLREAVNCAVLHLMVRPGSRMPAAEDNVKAILRAALEDK